MPGSARDECAERVAANLEIPELVVAGARGRQQHDRLAAAARRGVARRGCDGLVERSAALEGDFAVKCRRELVARLADQVGLGDAAEIGREAVMPPSLGLPPRIQKMSRGNDSSAFSVESALVALLSLMKRTLPERGRSPPSGAARPGTTPARLASRDRTDRPSAIRHSRTAATAASAFCALCAPRSVAMPARIAELDRQRRRDWLQTIVLVEQAVARRNATARRVNATRPGPYSVAPLSAIASAELVIDADSRDCRRPARAALSRRHSSRSCRAGRDGRA